MGVTGLTEASAELMPESKTKAAVGARAGKQNQQGEDEGGKQTPKGKGRKTSTTRGKKRPLDVSKYPLHFRTKRGKRRFWTKEELAALLKGVSRYGSGNWVHIKCDPELGEVLHQRTTVDIKDKWRTYKREEQRRREGKPKQAFEPGSTPKRTKRTLRDTEDFPGAIVSNPTSRAPPPPVGSGSMMMGSAIYDRDFGPDSDEHTATQAPGASSSSTSAATATREPFGHNQGHELGGAIGGSSSSGADVPIPPADSGLFGRQYHPRRFSHPGSQPLGHEVGLHGHHLYPDSALGFESNPIQFPFPDPIMAMSPPPPPTAVEDSDAQPEFWTIRLQLLHPRNFATETAACGDVEHVHIINVALGSQTKDLTQYLITQWFKNPQLNPHRYLFYYDTLRLRTNDFLATKGVCDKSVIYVEVDPTSPMLLPTPTPIIPSPHSGSHPDLHLREPR